MELMPRSTSKRDSSTACAGRLRMRREDGEAKPAHFAQNDGVLLWAHRRIVVANGGALVRGVLYGRAREEGVILLALPALTQEGTTEGSGVARGAFPAVYAGA